MIKFISGILVCFLTGVVFADAVTMRTPEFENQRVKVWKTVVYPGKQVLKSHRHDRDRVVVAMESGILKIVNDKGVTHYLRLEKAKAYYLEKDTPAEMHTDENIGKQPITVMVIELK